MKVTSPMTVDLRTQDIHVLRSSKTPDGLKSYAVVFRQLRLQSLQESPDSFTEDYHTARSQPMAYWQTFIQHHTGLIHMAFAVSKSRAATIDAASNTERHALILEHGKPLSIAVNTGPVPQHLFRSDENSCGPPNRPDEHEQRCHGGMLYHIPEMRGTKGTTLMRHLLLDRDEWLREMLLSTSTKPPPMARFRGNVRPGRNQARLIEFYVRSGWYIAGSQTWRTNLMAEGGPDAVRASELRGDDMEEVSVVVEKIFTVPLLEWQMRRNRELLDRRARL